VRWRYCSTFGNRWRPYYGLPLRDRMAKVRQPRLANSLAEKVSIDRHFFL